MANLIITIVSIALVAVAAAMAAYYGGTAFENAQINAMANTLISQGHQLYAANINYMVNNGFSSFNDFPDDAVATANYTTGIVPIINFSGTESNFGSGTPGFSYSVCGNMNGHQVLLARAHANLYGNNNITYAILSGSNNSSACPTAGAALDLSLAANVNNPLVQMCLYINSFTTIPAGFTIAPSGLPYYTANPAANNSYGISNYSITDYANSAAATNFCVLVQNSYWAANPSFSEIILTMTN